MFEIIHLAGNTYCFTMPTNVGIYLNDDNSVFLIDTGINDKSAQKILAALDEKGWSVKAVLLTHAHTDHAGGCRYITEHTGCKAYATEAERIFVEYPDLEPAMVFGSFPCCDFRTKVMNTPACKVEDIREIELPAGFEIFHLPGHFADMIGFRTPDDVYFTADGVISPKTLERSPMSYIFDVERQFETLEKIKSLDGKLCVPSHDAPTRNIALLAQKNIEALHKVNEDILEFLQTPQTAEVLAQMFADKWNLPQEFMYHVMTSSGVKAHLTYLRHKGRVEYFFEGAKMLWKKSDLFV